MHWSSHAVGCTRKPQRVCEEAELDSVCCKCERAPRRRRWLQTLLSARHYPRPVLVCQDAGPYLLQPVTMLMVISRAAESFPGARRDAVHLSPAGFTSPVVAVPVGRLRSRAWALVAFPGLCSSCLVQLHFAACGLRQEPALSLIHCPSRHWLGTRHLAVCIACLLAWLPSDVGSKQAETVSLQGSPRENASRAETSAQAQSCGRRGGLHQDSAAFPRTVVGLCVVSARGW